jgi:hypothetical protein
MDNNIKTASGAELNNDLIGKVLQSTEQQNTAPLIINTPSDNLVTLPAGYITPAGEVIKTAEVRELNGKDEEVIGKSNSIGKAFNAILNRAVVKLGDVPATEGILDSLVSGDRDALMLGIFKATFGKTAQISTYCGGCDDFKDVEVDVDRDIKVKILVDAVADRTFTVQGKNSSYEVTLPTGVVQKELSSNVDRNGAEQTTILLQHTILEIDGKPVMGKAQVQAIGLVDRKKIGDEIAKRLPGPQFDDIVIDCSDCEGKVVVPINLGTLFRF